ncbi:MAG: NAD(P)-binding domain-containing protein, partial [Lachnospiraceae bacterium]|nr:NAD(P)-binding domain-containing protein [Lachnospiraceae bacterium]
MAKSGTVRKKVYIARSGCDVLKGKLENRGFEVLEKEGAYDEKLLLVCDALVPGKIPVTREVLDLAPNLKVISKFGVGVDRIDIPACSAQGIYVCNTPRSNYVSVAEQAITLLLMAAKKIYPVTRKLREEADWNGARRYQGTELYGKTLSVIGLGNIGKRVAALAYAFGMNIVGYDPYTDGKTLPDYITLKNTLEETLTEGDFVTLHVAGTESTRGMIGKEQLACMKSDAIIVNTTRGFVIDEQALIEALEKKSIAGAALDVFA